MKTERLFQTLLFLAVIIFSSSCEDFLEIEAPDQKMISDVVFDSDETALGAMKGIYNQLFRASFSGGGFNSVTILAGISSDNLAPIRTTPSPYLQFDQYDILPDNSRNNILWSGAYNILYLTNSLLEGIENSNNISQDVYNRLKGEATFVRGFTHFYLVNLYGEVPLILTTSYKENALATRNNIDEVYDQIINDFLTAEALLDDGFSSGERTQINRITAVAMLARVHLFLENYPEAEEFSTQIIDQSATYEILDDLNEVFLANSREAIWQISPEGQGYNLTHTNDGNILIVEPNFSFAAQIKIEPKLTRAFDEHDKRLINWIGHNEDLDVFFAHKYKIWNSNALPIEEYSMALRLAEQYLIRAEARAKLGNINGAIGDLDIIRSRAGVHLLSETNPQPNKDQLLDLILKERRLELFSEWGHRWLDLKRTGKIGETLVLDNQDWEKMDELYPIPEAELMKNPNLHQNPGY